MNMKHSSLFFVKSIFVAAALFVQLLATASFAQEGGGNDGYTGCGDTSNSVTVFGGGSGKFTVSFLDWRNRTFAVSLQGAPAGTTLSSQTLDTATASSVEVTVNPDRSNNGSTVPFTVVFSRFTDEVQYSCEASVQVVPNTPPTCNITGAESGAYRGLSCSASRTTAKLAATFSDIDQQPLTEQWSSNCPAAVFAPGIGDQTSLTFNSETSNGFPTSCTASVIVSDGIDSTTCSVPLSVFACLKDCSGSINGNTAYDACGVCGGNGSTCKDCKGIVNGANKVDQCGVCGGDGTSCYNCVVRDIKTTQLKLDGGAFNTRRMITNFAKSLRKASDRTRVIADANAAYAQTWRSIWSIQTISSLCGNTALCSTLSLSASTQSVVSANNNLQTLANQLYRTLITEKMTSKRVLSTFAKRIRSNAQLVASELNNLPQATSSCK